MAIAERAAEPVGRVQSESLGGRAQPEVSEQRQNREKRLEVNLEPAPCVNAVRGSSRPALRPRPAWSVETRTSPIGRMVDRRLCPVDTNAIPTAVTT